MIGKGESADNMKRLLESAQLNVESVSPTDAPVSYDSLIAYDSIVLADVAYDELSEELISATYSFVKYAGGGLITVGGENSYGPGGYADTPLEEILPFDM